MKTLKEENDERAASLIGKRVYICDKSHPWVGEFGKILKFDFLAGKNCAIVELDNGVECAVYSGHSLKILSTL